MMFQDCHLHLQDAPSGIAHEILEKTRFYHVERLFCNATSPKDFERVAAIARRYRGVIPFFGIHPWFIDDLADDWLARLEQVLEQYPQSGLGEIGLDRGRKAGDYEKQKMIFNAELQIAGRLKRPFIVHSVYAWDDILSALRSGAQGSVPFMAHGFSEHWPLARAILDLGGYISVSLRLLDGKYKDVLTQIPDDRLLVETDFPYHQRRDRDLPLTAEEYFFTLTQTYERVAQCKGVNVDQLAATVWNNGVLFLQGLLSRVPNGPSDF